MRHYVFVGITERTIAFYQALVKHESEQEEGTPTNILACLDRGEGNNLVRMSDEVYRSKEKQNRYIPEMQLLQLLDRIEGGMVDDEEVNEHGIGMVNNPFVLLYENEQNLREIIDRKTKDLSPDTDETVFVVDDEELTSDFLHSISDNPVVYLSKMNVHLQEADLEEVGAPFIHAYNVVLSAADIASRMYWKLHSEFDHENELWMQPKNNTANVDCSEFWLMYQGADIQVRVNMSNPNGLYFQRMCDLYESVSMAIDEGIKDHVLCDPDCALEEMKSFPVGEHQDFFRKNRRTGDLQRFDAWNPNA